MALINCPECNKEVSDRAHSCPICGFPLDEYFQEIEEEKKQKEFEEFLEREKIRIEEKRKEFSKREEFTLGKSKLEMNRNEMICAVIGSVLHFEKEHLHEKIIEEILESDNESPADFRPNRFNEFAQEMVKMISIPLMEASAELIDKFLDEGDSVRANMVSDIYGFVDYTNLYNDLLEEHRRLFSDYDLASMNAHLNYYDEYYAAGTPAQPISEVYSNSVLGLLGKNISAKLVNSVASGLTEGSVAKKEKQAARNYYNKVSKERLIFNVKIYSVLDGYVDNTVDLYQKCIFRYLQEENVLFSTTTYPKGKVNFDKYVTQLEDETISNLQKIEQFEKMVKINPGDYIIYAISLRQISFNANDIKEIVRLTNCLKIDKQIKKWLKDMKCEAFKFYEENIDIGQVLEHASTLARTYNHCVFSTVEEKEQYIEEEKKYSDIQKRYFGIEHWFCSSIYLAIYDQLEKKGRPNFEKWQKTYDDIILKGKKVADEVRKNKFLNKMEGFITALWDDKKFVTRYELSEIEDIGKNSIIEKYPNLKEYFHENELPIVIVGGNVNKLLISTRFLYVIDKSNQVVIQFDIDDIGRVNVCQKSFSMPAYFSINVKNNNYVIINSDIPQSDFRCITSFVNRLSGYVKRNPNIIQKNFEERYKNTDDSKLSKEYIEKQEALCSKICCMVSKRDYIKQDEVIQDWSYNFSIQDEDVRYDIKGIIDENNIGIEFIFSYDGSVMVTNEAVYVVDKSSTARKGQAKRYAYDKYIEIFMGCTYGESWQNRKGMFVISKKRNELIPFYHDNIGTVTAYIDAMAVLLNIEGISSNLHLISEFNYCKNCSTFHDISLTRCPGCNAKYKKSGWLNYSGYEYSKNLYYSVSEKELVSFQKKIVFDFKKFQLAQDKIGKKNEDENVCGTIDSTHTKSGNGIDNNNCEKKEEKNEPIEDTMFCVFCGKKIMRKSKFCNFCGKPNKYGAN